MKVNDYKIYRFLKDLKNLGYKNYYIDHYTFVFTYDVRMNYKVYIETLYIHIFDVYNSISISMEDVFQISPRPLKPTKKKLILLELTGNIDFINFLKHIGVVK